MSEEKYIGYLKYYGEASVNEGLLDMRKSAEALVGFDEILRHFLSQEDPSLKNLDFEIPVRIRKGSWEAAIPETIDKLISPGGVAATGAAVYLSTFAKKAAQDGLFSTGAAKDLKQTIVAAIKSAQWVIKIGSHVGTLTKQEFENVRIDSATQTIEIPNLDGKFMAVPKKYLDLYSNCPEGLFSKNVKIVENGRKLEIGSYENGKRQKVVVTEKEKSIFYTGIDSVYSGIVLPELQHGQAVELDGVITRVTESVNTIGFQFNGHTIICKPAEGNVAKYKSKIVSTAMDHVFAKAKIRGVVDRTDKAGGFKEKRPTIFFTDIISIEDEIDEQSALL